VIFIFLSISKNASFSAIDIADKIVRPLNAFDRFVLFVGFIVQSHFQLEYIFDLFEILIYIRFQLALSEAIIKSLAFVFRSIVTFSILSHL